MTLAEFRVSRQIAPALKRKPFIAIATVAVATATAVITLAIQPDPSIEWPSFQARLRQMFVRSGFITVQEKSCGADQVPLPLSVRWHPRRWFVEAPALAITGFPNSAELYTVSLNGQSADCFVRYVDGRASVIDVRGDSANQDAAVILHSNVAQEFPKLPIRMQTYQ